MKAGEIAKTNLMLSQRKAGEIARTNLKVSQRRMKAWYDQNVRKRFFKVGDEVLILLPIQGQPLQARYSGPFTIERKINDVDYIVYTPGRRKEKCLCHINMFKLYQERKSEEETMPSQYEVYFCLREPLLFLWCLLSSSVSRLFLVHSV